MRERTSRNLDFALILCAILAAGMFIFVEMEKSAPVLFLTAISALCAAFAVYLPEKASSLADFCFRYRWAIALLLFILCLILLISGSSIGIYDEVFPTQIDQAENTWFGVPRMIRSDEFGVQTPKFFSQAYNDYALYSNRISLSPSNMVLDYYSPVWDLTALGKPLMWGYLLFGSTIGLSWYWCGMVILLFMTALEMLLILTGGSRRVSFVGAVMITLSPAIQWWMLPHMPIVILYAMALFCVGYHFFTAETTFWKWGYALLVIITALGYVLSIFPSFQVPCGYGVIILLAVCLWRDKDRISFRGREWYRIAIPVAVTLGILICFVISCREDFSLLLNTVYPGERMECGGTSSIKDLFTDLTSLFLSYNPINYANNCEVSTYIHFAPLFIVMFPGIFVFLRRKHSEDLGVGTALTVLLLLYGFYMVVGIPPFMAKVTFLRYCNRMKGVYGWLATLYTVWGIYILEKYPDLLKRWQKILYPIVYGAACVLLVDGNTIAYFESFEPIRNIPIGKALLIGEIIVFTALLLCVFWNRRRLSAWGLVIVMIVAGAVVNPVEHGTGAVTNHPISSCIAEISAEDPDALWLCTDCVFFMSNFASANGARVMNATNFYPDTDKWKIIDPDGIYEECTNRYANQSTSLSDDEKPGVELVTPDYINYTLTPDTLRSLGIHYLLSTVDYSELLNAFDIQCELEISQDGYEIYHLIY